MARAKEKLEQREKKRATRKMPQQKPEVEEVEEEVEEVEEEVELDDLTYMISLEDLEKYLGITIPPKDRMKLESKWNMKMREPCIRQLLENAQSMDLPYALIPRLPRYIKDGQQVTATVVNLLRAYPQLFENVPQVIKYRTEPFFLQESPELDWAIVACEALPATRNQNYMQQGLILKQYGQSHGASQRRVQRRTLVEALYDLIMVQLIHKEHMLEESVELTDSKVGLQSFACINYGDNGIRISEFSRQQVHPQLGVCPSW